MKKEMLVVALALVIGLTFTTRDGNAQMGSGMMAPGIGFGNGMGSGMMGGGMMGGGSTGPETLGPGYGSEYGPQYRQPQKQLEKNEAREILENYLNSTRNPNLKMGKIEDKGSAFEGEILTKNGSLVDRIQVDKNTGRMRSVY